MDPVVVQRLMGHTDIVVTLNTYTSVYDKFKEKEVDKVNQYYLEENIAMLDKFKNLELPNTNEFYLDNENSKNL